MADDEKNSGGWLRIIGSVKTPLGFFTLAALILDAILTLMAQFSGLSILAPLAVLLILIVCVFVIVMKRPEALYPPGDWPAAKHRVRVNLSFPIEAINVDLDIQRCALEILDANGKAKYAGPPNLRFGPGGWSMELSESVEPGDAVAMELVERGGRKWRVLRFAPYESVQTPFEIREVPT